MRHLIFASLCALAIAGCDKKDDSARTDVNVRTGYDSRTDADKDYDVTKPKDADDTSRNVRDRNDASVTPVDQKENEADIKRTADIRKRIVDTKLSVNAQNVKVVTMNGRVTLRGPVKSQAEKDSIESIARDVAGAGNVDNQLEVETSR